jgi:[ribosomal protein S5]-alanine N-acetyltransferase
MKLPDSLPTLASGPVLLKGPAPGLEVLRDAAADPYIRLLYGFPELPDEEFTATYGRRLKARLRAGLGASFSISEASSGRIVGGIGLWLRARAPDGTTGYLEEAHGRASVGYWVCPSYRRRGYASHALVAMSRWALALEEVQRLELYVEPWNEGSWRAAERAGYRREGLLRSWQLLGSRRRDMYVYSLLPSEIAAASKS